MKRIVKRFFYLHEGRLGWYVKTCGTTDRYHPVPDGPFDLDEAQVRLEQAVTAMARSYRIEPFQVEHRGHTALCLAFEPGTAQQRARGANQAFTIRGGSHGGTSKGSAVVVGWD